MDILSYWIETSGKVISDCWIHFSLKGFAHFFFFCLSGYPWSSNILLCISSGGESTDWLIYVFFNDFGPPSFTLFPSSTLYPFFLLFSFFYTLVFYQAFPLVQCWRNLHGWYTWSRWKPSWHWVGALEKQATTWAVSVYALMEDTQSLSVTLLWLFFLHCLVERFTLLSRGYTDTVGFLHTV